MNNIEQRNMNTKPPNYITPKLPLTNIDNKMEIHNKKQMGKNMEGNMRPKLQ